jgi:hypothetical protein
VPAEAISGLEGCVAARTTGRVTSRLPPGGDLSLDILFRFVLLDDLGLRFCLAGVDLLQDGYRLGLVPIAQDLVIGRRELAHLEIEVQFLECCVRRIAASQQLAQVATVRIIDGA